MPESFIDRRMLGGCSSHQTAIALGFFVSRFFFMCTKVQKPTQNVETDCTRAAHDPLETRMDVVF
jgi:hypothetical protein